MRDEGCKSAFGPPTGVCGPHQQVVASERFYEL